MMPSGQYYVGDLCYVMHPQWDEVCSLILSDDLNEDGEYTLKNGVRFAVHRTLYGDGTYFDNEGRSYSVDAGIIGCILVTDIDDNTQSPEGGNVVNFSVPFETSECYGQIRFADFCIETGDIEDDDEEDYQDGED